MVLCFRGLGGWVRVWGQSLESDQDDDEDDGHDDDHDDVDADDDDPLCVFQV